MNIADVLTEHARKRPDHPAIEDGDRIISYADLDKRVDDSAANLQSAGIASGDVVGIMLQDSIEYLIALLALARAGAVMVGLDDTLPSAEKKRLASSVNLKAVIAAEVSEPINGIKFVPIGTICQPATTAFERPMLGPDHPFMIGQSSGTTGEPKGFIWTHARMWVQAKRDERCLNLSGEDRYLVVVKMSFFVERWICTVMFCLGATIVVNRARSLKDFIERVSAEQITVLYLTPAHLTTLLDHPDDRRPLFPSVRVMFVGSAPLTNEKRTLVRKRLTPNLYEQHGTNEVGFLVVGSPIDQDARPDAIGRIIDDIEAKVVDADGRPLPPGEVGLVGFRGEGFPNGYIDNPEATARAFRDGWFYPGDLAAIDADGFFFFKGRADDVINNAGAKFYPVEVERVLLAHPAVAEAAVFGWPHSRHGEVGVAYVVAKEDVTAPELGDFCRKRIAGWKAPYWIVFVDQLPKNAMGKTLRTELKRIFGETRDNRSF